MLDRLRETIIPADEQSPGAHQAQVWYFIDLMVQYSDPQNQQPWRAGVHIRSIRLIIFCCVEVGTRSPRSRLGLCELEV
jgi:hypothetical protein